MEKSHSAWLWPLTLFSQSFWVICVHCVSWTVCCSLTSQWRLRLCCGGVRNGDWRCLVRTRVSDCRAVCFGVRVWKGAVPRCSPQSQECVLCWTTGQCCCLFRSSGCLLYAFFPLWPQEEPDLTAPPLVALRSSRKLGHCTSVTSSNLTYLHSKHTIL